MKFASFLLLPLLLCNIPSGLAGNFLSKPERNRTPTKFTKLNTDVQHIIFSQLNFIDLIFLEEAIPSTYPVVLDAIRKIGYEVKICRDIVYNIQEVRNVDYEQNIAAKKIELYRLGFAFEILKKFGKVLRKISFDDYYYYSTENDEISQNINRYARESLEILNMGSLQENTFEKFTEPFEKVKELTLTVNSIPKLNHEAMPLNETFPKLSNLALFLKSSIDYRFIDVEFRNLKHLYIEGSSEALEQRGQIENFLRKNAQISYFQVKYMRKDFIRVISGDILPNVKTLSIDGFDVGAHAIRIKRVTKFIVWDANSASIEQLSLPKLQSLELNYSEENLDAWIEFFQRHEHLTDLHIFGPLTWEAVPLVELTAPLENLESLYLGCSNHITSETLGKFIRDHKKLKTFKFSQYRFDDNEMAKLRARFESKWSFSEIPGEWAWVLERMDQDD